MGYVPVQNKRTVCIYGTCYLDVDIDVLILSIVVCSESRIKVLNLVILIPHLCEA